QQEYPGKREKHCARPDYEASDTFDGTPSMASRGARSRPASRHTPNDEVKFEVSNYEVSDTFEGVAEGREKRITGRRAPAGGCRIPRCRTPRPHPPAARTPRRDPPAARTPRPPHLGCAVRPGAASGAHGRLRPLRCGGSARSMPDLDHRLRAM